MFSPLLQKAALQICSFNQNLTPGQALTTPSTVWGGPLKALKHCTFGRVTTAPTKSGRSEKRLQDTPAPRILMVCLWQHQGFSKYTVV